MIERNLWRRRPWSVERNSLERSSNWHFEMGRTIFFNWPRRFNEIQEKRRGE
jgi:hypothetical protein